MDSHRQARSTRAGRGLLADKVLALRAWNNYNPSIVMFLLRIRGSQ